jgi:nucleoside-diphosphate-sugar epimerase
MTVGMKLFVFGFGYTGAALARRLAPAGWTVAGTSRTGEGRAELADQGVVPVDPSDGEAVAAAAEADAILVSTPPTGDGCPALIALAPTLERTRPGWIGYLSTTGVYGDRRGGWVFETSALLARSTEGARRVGAERDWLEYDACVFRLPGIYGPGRSPLDRLRQGTARRLVKPGQVFSRIHVDDVAAGLAASIARPRPGGIYNLCDDEPAAPAEVTAFAAGLLGIAPPPEEPFDTADVSPAAQRFWAESKRVSNARAKAELGWRPAYPSYREGLRAVLADEKCPSPLAGEGGRGAAG